MGRQAGEARLPGRGAGHHEEQINCHAAIPQTSPRGTTPTMGRTYGYEDAPTGMLQVAHEFEFTRYRFNYILQKPGLNRNSKKQISTTTSTNYKDFTPNKNPPLSVNGRKIRLLNCFRRRWFALTSPDAIPPGPVIRATTRRLSNPVVPRADCRKAGHGIRRTGSPDADSRP